MLLRHININPSIVGDANTPLSPIDINLEKIYKEITKLIDITYHNGLDIYLQNFVRKHKRIYTFFSSVNVSIGTRPSKGCFTGLYERIKGTSSVSLPRWAGSGTLRESSFQFLGTLLFLWKSVVISPKLLCAWSVMLLR